MSKWNCCRSCLGVASLNPIFSQTVHSEFYTKVIFIATGIQVEMNDSLPQQMCHSCINFINEVIKFRKTCELNQQALRDKIETEICDLKQGSQCNGDKAAFLDISEYVDNDFRDYDDNITLSTLQCMDKSESDNPKVELDNHIEVKHDKVQGIDKSKKTELVKEVKKSRSKKKEVEGEKKVVKCEYCHKILTSKFSLRNHYKIHTGFDFVCEHCGKKFITRRLLLMHCRAKHGYEKTDKCSFCDYRASNAEQVKIHERLHTGEKPFVCACGAGFHRRSSYLQHAAIHLPERTVPCEQCGARFKSVTLMRIHVARHRAPRYSYWCVLCERRFARRRNVARHVQKIHNMSPEPHTISRREIAAKSEP